LRNYYPCNYWDLITVLLLGGSCVYSNDPVNASSAAKKAKEIVGSAADDLNEISKSIQEGINDNPESESNINTDVQNSNSPILLEVPSLNESTTNSGTDNPDMIATKMKFGDKQDLGLGMLMYSLKDQNFVVNNSRICPDQNCKFQFKDTNLVYQPNSNDITMKGNLKVDTGEVTKITNFTLIFNRQKHEKKMA